MKVIFLGTSSSIPTPTRSPSSVALIHNAVAILFDCGEGTQMQIQRAQLRPSKIRHILISHLHGDHFFGLPGFLTSQQMQGRKTKLQIWGPPGLRRFIDTVKSLTTFEPDYAIEICEARLDHENVWDVGSGLIRTRKLNHTVPTLGFRYEANSQPGKFDVHEAERLGIPEGPLRQVLQNGQKVILSNGEEVHPEQVLGPPRPGKVIAYCVDTRPCDASIELATNADLLIHDATFDAGEEERAEQSGHSTVAQAAQIGVTANARKLALTHMSARYSDRDDKFLLAHAQDVFANTVLASDLQTLIV